VKSFNGLMVDDHSLFRKGIAAAINGIRPDWTFTEAMNGSEAIERIQDARFDFALVDVKMPVMGGIEFTRRLKAISPELPVIILTSFDEQSLIVHFLQMGVNGFMYKNSEPEELVKAIEIVVARGRYMNELMIKAMEMSVGNTSGDRVRLDLSSRDKEIISLLRHGKNSKQIASLLNLSEASIESYRKDLLHKTKTRNVAELVSLAHRTGII